MLPPLLSALRQSLSKMQPPLSDAQDALLAELQSLDKGELPRPPANRNARSLGTPVDVCPVCLRPFGV